MKKFWIGLALGALAAAVTVSLFAPQNGRSTRKKLRRGLEDLGDNVSDAAEYLKDQAERLAKEAQKLVDTTTSKITSQMDDVIEDAAGTARGYAKAAKVKVGGVGSRLM